MPYPTKPKGGWQRPRQVVVNKSTAQLREKKAAKKFLNKYPELFQTNMAQSSNNPPGLFLYQEDGKTYASLPAEMLRNIQSSHLYEKMEKDWQNIILCDLDRNIIKLPALGKISLWSTNDLESIEANIPYQIRVYGRVLDLVIPLEIKDDVHITDHRLY